MAEPTEEFNLTTALAETAAGATGTDWSLIGAAALTAQTPRAASAREALTRRYWPAVYAYVRRSGRDVHDAADATQGFICDVMIGRKLFAGADRTRGRFRTLLLTSLRNYLHERHRHDTRAKRSPGPAGVTNLNLRALAELEYGAAETPEAAFAAQWAASLLRQVLLRVQNSCATQGLEAHWEIFKTRVVKPMLAGEAPETYETLVHRLDLTDASQASNMMITVKRRFARALLEEVSRTVDSPDEVEDEIRALLRDLERRR